MKSVHCLVWCVQCWERQGCEGYVHISGGRNNTILEWRVAKDNQHLSQLTTVE